MISRRLHPLFLRQGASSRPRTLALPQVERASAHPDRLLALLIGRRFQLPPPIRPPLARRLVRERMHLLIVGCAQTPLLIAGLAPDSCRERAAMLAARGDEIIYKIGEPE